MVRYLSGKCRHRHKFSEHPQCFYLETGAKERIGFLDIETNDLRADWGFITCYVLRIGNTEYVDAITKQDIRKWGKEGREDTRVLRSLVERLNGCDRIVGHFSSLFDIPFIRTRAVVCGVEFPTYGCFTQADSWRALRNKFKLSRNSLENGSRTLVGETEKNHFRPEIMRGCIRGEEWALRWSLDHCRRDVRDTQRLWEKVSPYVRLTNTSI
jgi:uncharacterized protein YprB with RNaseH-like and TPR domain